MAKTKTRINATARNLFLDIALTVGFLLTLKPFLTGIALHEWLGLAVGGGLIAHALLHRKWISAITCRIGCKLPWRTRVCYLLDALLLIAFGLLIITGLLISQAVLPTFGILMMPSLLLAQVHNIAAWTALGALALKLGLHTEWIINAVRCHILRRQAVRTGRPVHCPEEASGVRAALYSRRQFLSACGLGLGSAMIFGLWRSLDPALVKSAEVAAQPPAQPLSSMQSQSVIPTTTVTINPGTTSEAPATAKATVAAEPVLPVPQEPEKYSGDATEATATAEVTATAIAVAPAVTIEPLPTATPVATQVVRTRCPYGLVNDPYPGKCRRYVDANGNGYCDLSESA